MSAKAEASGKLQKVQRITDWYDARSSFLPARTADDLRATQFHLRLLILSNIYGVDVVIVLMMGVAA